jgi:hypothetical protein
MSVSRINDQKGLDNPPLKHSVQRQKRLKQCDPLIHFGEIAFILAACYNCARTGITLMESEQKSKEQQDETPHIPARTDTTTCLSQSATHEPGGLHYPGPVEHHPLRAGVA